LSSGSFLWVDSAFSSAAGKLLLAGVPSIIGSVYAVIALAAPFMEGLVHSNCCLSTCNPDSRLPDSDRVSLPASAAGQFIFRQIAGKPVRQCESLTPNTGRTLVRPKKSTNGVINTSSAPISPSLKVSMSWGQRGSLYSMKPA